MRKDNRGALLEVDGDFGAKISGELPIAKRNRPDEWRLLEEAPRLGRRAVASRKTGLHKPPSRMCGCQKDAGLLQVLGTEGHDFHAHELVPSAQAILRSSRRCRIGATGSKPFAAQNRELSRFAVM
jgi:hypothetical protein